MKFRAYGHPVGRVEDTPLELSEVSLSASPSVIRALGKHLLKVADTMEKMGEDFDHEHLRMKIEYPDLVVCKKTPKDGTSLAYAQLGKSDGIVVRVAKSDIDDRGNVRNLVDPS